MHLHLIMRTVNHLLTICFSITFFLAPSLNKQLVKDWLLEIRPPVYRKHNSLKPRKRKTLEDFFFFFSLLKLCRPKYAVFLIPKSKKIGLIFIYLFFLNNWKYFFQNFAAKNVRSWCFSGGSFLPPERKKMALTDRPYFEVRSSVKQSFFFSCSWPKPQLFEIYTNFNSDTSHSSSYHALQQGLNGNNTCQSDTIFISP